MCMWCEGGSESEEVTVLCLAKMFHQGVVYKKGKRFSSRV